MNNIDLQHILKNPNNIDVEQTTQLDMLLQEFPYFQAARAVQLNGLNKLNSYKYNQTLKTTSAYTIDRKVLFEFITSPLFLEKIKNDIEILEDIEVIDLETINVESTIAKKEKFIFKESESDPEIILGLGKPINFKQSEPHTFNEWMQLSLQKPIDRTLKKEEIVNNKFRLIDQFIETNPKIKPVDKTVVNIDLLMGEPVNNDNLMTETLAKVYLEQKKYDNAIQAYHILSLKYPEKSGFFADRIKAIKILQKNKS
ncbi:hypothetical protein [Lutibacter sp.]|uniref:hypothetical protein n=1 Tax=Lutibacter sp. TaxID=1925666 RepID=UPI002735A146|nr:hypothetical protein [Lutibacter sp.]MDP3311846.1 hypothetical protein [Lutibacter sp.]